MILNAKNPSTLNDTLSTLYTDLTHLEHSQRLTHIPQIEEVFQQDPTFLNSIKYNFIHDFKSLDHILHSLHYKRDRLNSAYNYNVLRFLTTGYLLSNDVRYFNEFLWFYKVNSDTIPLFHLLLWKFYNNLNDHFFHPFPLASASTVEEFLSQVRFPKSYVKPKSITNDKYNIGLVGFPPFFSNIYQELVADGYNLFCYHIPYHQDRMYRILLRRTSLTRLLFFFKGVTFPYKTLKYPHDHIGIYDLLSEDNLDVGFHKLGFIIRKNIINPFRIGLLNDHWGLLPFIRGKSTIEYSVLFGFPLCASVHYVDEGVDTGDIIGVFSYDFQQLQRKSLKTLRNQIRRHASERVVRSVQYVCSTKGKAFDNNANLGLTYYSIHPELARFIDVKILRFEN